MLGAPESIRGTMSGLDFGLPLRNVDARNLAVSFASSIWMHPIEAGAAVADTALAAQPAFRELFNASVPGLWEERPIVTVSARADNGTRHTTAFPVGSFTAGDAYQQLDRLIPHAQFDALHANLRRLYWEDAVGNPLLPAAAATRPPVRKLLSIYGVGVRTDVAYHYAVEQPPPAPHADAEPSGNATIHLSAVESEEADGWTWVRPHSEIDVFGDLWNALVGAPTDAADGDAVTQPPRRRPTRVHRRATLTCGDGTVPYASLQFAHRWHLDARVTVQRHPERLSDTHHPGRVEVTDGVQTPAQSRPHGGWWWRMVRLFHTVERRVRGIVRRTPAYTKYRSVGEGERETVVYELQGVDHRSVVTNDKTIELIERHLLAAAAKAVWRQFDR